MITIQTIALTKSYMRGKVHTLALNNVSLEISKGEFIAIIGSSGSGKTTLLNMIGGLDKPSKGKVYINDISICDLDEEELSVFRRENIGFVFQNYNLLPILNAYENIVLPLKLQERKVDVNFIEEIAVSLGILEKLWQMPNELSGGEQQRVAIARALCTKPTIILADEPTGNLDSKASGEVIKLMKELASKYKQTIAIVTHNEKIAAQAERIIQMRDGEVIKGD